MSYIQEVQPNLSVVGLVGMCEKYTEDVFGVGTDRHDADAFLGWEQDAGQHPGETPPADICVPLAFDWYGTIDGEYKNWGHRCVWVKGQVYSSPLSGTGHLVYNSIAEIKSAFGLGNYLGWSECIENLRIVKEGDMPTVVDDNSNNDLAVGLLGYEAKSNPALAGHIGQPLDQALADYIRYPEHQRIMDQAAAYESDQTTIKQLTSANQKLTDQLDAWKNQAPTISPAPITDPNTVIVTKDGFWAAFKKFLGIGG